MTTRKDRLQQAEAELAQSRQRRQLHFERTPLAVIEWNLEFEVVEWNPAAERIFGYSREEAMGRHAAGLIVPEAAREHVDRVWGELCTRKGGLRSTNENNRKDGSIILCEWYNTALVDDSGHVLGVASLVQDITEQRRAEAALRASEENLRITLDSIAEAVISTDGHGRIVRINQVAESLTGWTRAEALGQPVDEVFRVVDHAHEPLETPVGIVMREHRAIDRVSDTRLLARDGREHEISQRCSPILDDDGEVVGVALVFRDETDKRALEEQIRQVRQLDALGQLAGGVAHDFNNMLVGIRGYAELLMLGFDEGEPVDVIELRSYAEGVVQAAATAADLTRKLLAFSRRGRTASVPIDVHAAITSAVGLLRRSIDRRISLVSELSAARSVIVGDAAQLQSVVLNLGLNARDAMPSGGTLTLSTSVVELDPAACEGSPFELKPGPYVRVQVTDTGTGMSEEVMGRMFEPFFSTKEVGQGTGLGLAAVYGTIVEHGGAVTVDSTEGEGTRFYVDLPLVAAQTRRVVTGGREPAPIQPERTAGVLIIEDEPLVRAMTQTMVRKLGYRSLVASDGHEGLATYLARRDEIDVVLLDIVMPRMNGPECFRALRAADPRADVILCSGFARDARITALMDEGLREFLPKPFSLEELRKVLQTVLASPSGPASEAP